MPTNSPKREAQILKRDRIRIELEEYILEEKKIRQKKGYCRVVVEWPFTFGRDETEERWFERKLIEGLWSAFGDAHVIIESPNGVRPLAQMRKT
jgi:hypothetical protein